MRERSLVVRLPLRTRLALWTAALLVACLGFLALDICLSQWWMISTVPTTRTCVANPEAQPACVGGGTVPQTVVMPVRFSPSTVGYAVRHARPQSIIALLGVLALATIATYWVSGMALKPVRRVSLAVRDIDVDNLEAQLPISGPNDELRDLARSFTTMLDRLRDGIERERRFVSDASHELRTPLAVLRTNLDVVQGDPGADIEEYRAAAERIDRSLTRLESLVEALLALATEQPLVLEEVSLTELVSNVVDELQASADRRGVGVFVTASEEATTLGDGALLRLAVRNVVENAIAYNHDGGWVRIAVRGTGAGSEIVVSDSGVGIAPDDQPFIFDRFWRVDRSRARDRGGAGLGLALASDIVRRHGGQILVESSVGEGSRFTLVFPVVPGGSLPEGGKV